MPKEPKPLHEVLSEVIPDAPIAPELVLTQPEPQGPLPADPRTTPELMTPAQKNAFYLKEHARILIANGQMTVEEAFSRNLISQADAAAIKLGQDLSAPLPVLDAPSSPVEQNPIPKRCC